MAMWGEELLTKVSVQAPSQRGLTKLAVALSMHTGHISKSAIFSNDYVSLLMYFGIANEVAVLESSSHATLKEEWVYALLSVKC